MHAKKELREEKRKVKGECGMSEKDDFRLQNKETEFVGGGSGRARDEEGRRDVKEVIKKSSRSRTMQEKEK